MNHSSFISFLHIGEILAIILTFLTSQTVDSIASIVSILYGDIGIDIFLVAHIGAIRNIRLYIIKINLLIIHLHLCRELTILIKVVLD